MIIKSGHPQNPGLTRKKLLSSGLKVEGECGWDKILQR